MCDFDVAANTELQTGMEMQVNTMRFWGQATVIHEPPKWLNFLVSTCPVEVHTGSVTGEMQQHLVTMWGFQWDRDTAPSPAKMSHTPPFAPQSWTVVLKLQDWSHSHSYFTETLLIRLKQSCLDSGKWEDSFSRIFLRRESNMLFFHPRKLFAWNQDTWLSLSLQLCNLGYLRHVK